MFNLKTTTKALSSVASVIAVMAIVAGCTKEAPPVSALDTAYAAMGGDTLKTITIKSHWAQWDPGESYAAADPLTPDDGASDLTQSRDLEHGLTRNDWVRPKADDGTMRTFTEVVTPTAGLVVGNDATNGRLPKRTNTSANPPVHTMSGPRLTATLRELERTNIIREMHQHPDRVADMTAKPAPNAPANAPPPRPTYQYTGDYGTFAVTLDPVTKLLTHATTKDWDALEGDSNYDAAFTDYRSVNGVQVPFKTTYTLNGEKVAEVTYSEATINPMLDAASFAIPTDVMASGPAPVEQTPFQWIIRRQFTGFYVDSGAYYTDEGDSLRLVDVAPNVSQVVGGSHNSLIIATNNSLILVDAPNDDGQSKWTMDAAAKKYPNKPIHYVILTHHHVDHAGGFRQLLSTGATLVVGPGDGDVFKKWLAAPQTTNPNAPMNLGMPTVIEVQAGGKWSANEGGRVVEAYAIGGPHSADALIAYVPQIRLGFVTDIWNPGTPVGNANPGLIAFADAVAKAGLRPLHFAGGHGGVGNYADVAQAVQKAKAVAAKK
jgi:glyoxylase-like metal-dependent hydrolase (beta-lactamase superfamily II)